MVTAWAVSSRVTADGSDCSRNANAESCLLLLTSVTIPGGGGTTGRSTIRTARTLASIGGDPPEQRRLAGSYATAHMATPPEGMVPSMRADLGEPARQQCNGSGMMRVSRRSALRALVATAGVLTI